ncbi:hypothetical protein SO694_00159056 [Aureococcus anophagefferens]|uniref:Fe2OG dioxygenase domain-containing protein n=1 Tax=Aureococcus anophagefferens TaxID=44056 RepID=A0ABR1G1D9_AURAN
MGKKQKQPRTEEEIAALRAERATQKGVDRCAQALEDAGFGGLAYEFSQGLRLVVEEEWQPEDADSIAGLQWAGGVRLARFFDDAALFPRTFWEAATVVELGAGCGLTSCVLAALGCPNVYCTDAETCHAAANVAANAAAMAARCGGGFAAPAVVRFAWGADAPPVVGADVLVCGDCLYDEAHGALLVEGLLAAAGPDTEIYVCGAVGVAAHAAFMALAPTHFEVAATLDPRLGAGVALLGRGVAVVDGVLTAGECARLVAALEASAEVSFWAEDAGDPEPRKFRDADTVEVACPAVAAAAWERAAPCLFPMLDSGFGAPAVAGFEADGSPPSVATRGLWAPAGFNDDFLLATYPAGGGSGFAPHSDGTTTRGLNCRSFYSVIVYLNEPPAGGGTRFYRDAAAKTGLVEAGGRWTGDAALALGDVAPRAGRALVFDQRLVHEGVPPVGDRKHIVRSDVLFERTPPIFDAPKEREAFATYEAGVLLSEAGRHGDAVANFVRAAKLAPDLAAELGI